MKAGKQSITNDSSAAGRGMMELSILPPPFTDKLPLPSRQFFMRLDDEDLAGRGVADQLIQQGAISLVSPRIYLPGRRAVAVELMLDDSQVERVTIPEAEERRRLAEDEEKFLSNTYIMHLGL